MGIFHPGWVQTEMTGFSGHLDTATCASQLIDRIKSLNMENTGAFFHSDGSELPW